MRDTTRNVSAELYMCFDDLAAPSTWRHCCFNVAIVEPCTSDSSPTSKSGAWIMHLNIAEPLLLHPNPRLASCLKQSPNDCMRSAGADLNKPKSLHHPIYRAVRSIQTPRTTPHSSLNLWSSIQPTLISYLFTIPPIHQSPRHVVLYARAAHVHALPSGPVLWVIRAALVRRAYADARDTVQRNVLERTCSHACAGKDGCREAGAWSKVKR
jgi:hypothetical protein